VTSLELHPITLVSNEAGIDLDTDRGAVYPSPALAPPITSSHLLRRDVVAEDLATPNIPWIYGTPVDTWIFVSLLSCGHTYTPSPMFATLVSRIITLAIPYDDYVTYACDYQHHVSAQSAITFSSCVCKFTRS
jgi:hypothetical protein